MTKKVEYWFGIPGDVRLHPYIIEFSYNLTSEKIIEMDEWCLKSCEGFYNIGYNTSHFELLEDMIAFKLRWI